MTDSAKKPAPIYQPEDLLFNGGVIDVAREVQVDRDKQMNAPLTEQWRGLLKLALSDDPGEAQSGNILLQVWLAKRPEHREHTMDVLRHLRDDHGPKNRIGECAICLVKVMWERGEDAMRRDVNAKRIMHPIFGSNPLFTDRKLLAYWMLTRELP